MPLQARWLLIRFEGAGVWEVDANMMDFVGNPPAQLPSENRVYSDIASRSQRSTIQADNHRHGVGFAFHPLVLILSGAKLS